MDSINWVLLFLWFCFDLGMVRSVFYVVKFLSLVCVFVALILFW